MSMTAVVPVRGGSRRLKNKNILPFAGSNILIHKIRQLQQVAEIDDIIVTSDSDVMLEMAASQGVKTHKRAPEYCDEKTKSFGEVVEYVCREMPGDHVAWVLATAPLLSPKDYRECIDIYYDALSNGYDSLISLEEFHRYLLDENGPINFEMGVKHVPSQELKPFYFIGGLTIAPRDKMMEWKYIYGKNPVRYIMNKRAGIDIDDELDYACAKAWLDMDESSMSLETYRKE
ncbi:MAG: acylneuraminate cytidylyltransferase family protein [Clostridium sp.]|nr:acylneuraminate cytidylyltransferase family protein [Clostridium sp.]